METTRGVKDRKNPSCIFKTKVNEFSFAELLDVRKGGNVRKGK